MTIGLFPMGLATTAGAEAPPEPDTREMWEIALEEGYTNYDTIDMCGGNSHLQGICVDDKMEYMYFSYTSALAKVDMKTGEVVASVGGFGQGSFGTPGGAHLGCLAYYDGKIYGSLEYKEPGKKFFVAVFDEDAITEVGMDIKEMDTGVYGILLDEPTSDFRDPLNDSDLITSEDGFAVNEQNLGHKFGCSGIDGVTFAPMPGDGSGKMYMFVAYGVYGNGTWGNRYDNNYNVLQVYDPQDFDSTDDSVLRRFSYERGLTLDYEADEILSAHDTLYVWTGNTSYGAQNIEYDKDTGDIVLYTYGPIRSWSGGKTMYVVDGSKAPIEKEIEVGQSNTNSDQAAHDAAVAKAESYQVDGEYPAGKHAVLKCICGGDCQEKECGDTGITAMICGGYQPKSSTTGIASIGNGYYYIADGATTASLYKRDDNYNFERVKVTRPAEAILHYSMDDADLYEKNGMVYMKDTLGTGYDAVVEGTSAGKGATGEAGGSLSFNAWNYPAEPDQLYLEGEAIDYINAETGRNSYSYSFWSKMAIGADTDGNFDPFIGFYRADDTYAGVFEQRWRTNMKYVVNGIGSDTVGTPGDSGAYLNNSKATPADEGWHFYTVTEGEGAGSLYYDGVKVGEYSVLASHLIAKPFASFRVGGGAAKLWLDMNNRGRLIGFVDDITIYSGELTAEQVQAAYDAKKDSLDADPTALPDKATPSQAVAGTGFAPAYPVFDLTADAGQTLAVTAEKDVKSVFTLTAENVAISGKTMTFNAGWLSRQECGIIALTVEYTDGTTGTLKLTVTDRDTPVLDYTFAKGKVTGNVVQDTGHYGVDAYTAAFEFGMDHEATENGALEFDGHNYADPTCVKLDGEDAAWLNSVLQEGYTINFWAKADIENGNKMSMLGLYAADARPLGVVETYDCDGGDNTLQADGKMTVQLDVADDKNSEYARTTAAAATTNDWYMYTATYDKATKTTKLYINGEEAASKVVTADVIGEIAQFYIGTQYKKYYSTTAAEDWTTRGGFKGLMDSLVVYNNALNENEIKTLYGGGSITPGMKAKPVMHWTLDANTLSGDGTIAESAKDYTSYYQNVTPVAGVDGNDGGALYFNGAADSGAYSRVWLGEEGVAGINEDIQNQVTMSFWMKPDYAQTNESLPYTAAWSPVAGIYGADTRFLMVAEYRGNTLNYCATIPGLSDQRIQNTIAPADGQWYYVVMTWDGETSETVAGTSSVYRRIYITGEDGVTRVYLPDRAAATGNENTAKLLDAIGHVEIGGQNSKGYWSDTNVRGRFVGAIDDLKIYNLPLTQSDVEKLYASKPITNNELYLPEYQFEIGVSSATDLTFAVRNAGALTAVSGLKAGEFSFENGVVTLDHDALVELGLGDNLLTLIFANGTRVIRITVVEDRAYFAPEVASFDKMAPADVSFDTRVSFANAPVSVEAEGLRSEDYTISGRTITIKADYLSAKQPGSVEFQVISENGEKRVMTVYVTNSAPADNEPYPVLYYKMDKADMTEGPAPVHGSVAGTIKDHSGNGIDLQYGGLTKSDSNKDGSADSSIFFDGYRDYDVSRAYLDENGMDYLKDVVDNQISFSFWHASPRITCNYMPVMGVFGENNRPVVAMQFNTTGGERQGANQNTNPAVITTPVGSADPNAGVTKSDSAVAMNNTWHHYVVVYDGKTGTAILYVDNVQKAQQTVGTDQLADMAKFEIGGLTNASYYNIGYSNWAQYSRGRLYGDLDEVKVYNVALTAENVKALYEMGVDKDLPFDTTGVETGETNSGGNAAVEGTEGASYLVNVTYLDGGSAKPIVGAEVSLDEARKMQIRLPVGNNNQNVSVTVSGAGGTPVAEMDVVLTDGDGFVREGKTDAAGLAAFSTAKKLSGIAMESYPDTVQYTVGASEVDLTGAALTLTYDDGSTESLAVTKDMISGFDSSAAGADQITVTHGGFTTYFYVVITTSSSGGSGGSGSASYRIDVSAGKGGSATASATSAKAGSSITVTAKADKNYAIDSVIIANSAGYAVPFTAEDGVYTFIMPASSVNVTLIFKETDAGCDGGKDCPSASFADVTAASWFHEAVDYVVENGLFNGASATAFAPNEAMNYAMLVTVLYRLEGEPAVSGASKFNDVASGSYYEKAVIWACANGIVNGCTDTEFRPDTIVSREQMAAILYRYAEYKGYDVSAAASLDCFSDAAEISSYAADAVKWAVGEQLLSGVTAKTLVPQGDANRAQVAAILMRFCKNVAK